MHISVPNVAPTGRTSPEDLWPRVYGGPVPMLHFLPVPAPLQPLHSQVSASSLMAEQSWWVPQEPQELQSSSLQGLGKRQEPEPHGHRGSQGCGVPALGWSVPLPPP